MTYRCYLSVAGITFLLETDHLLIQNKEFEPFLIQPAEVEISACFFPQPQLPSLPERIVFSEDCYRIVYTNDGLTQKYFFEKPEDPAPYAVSTYDPSSGMIRVDYLDTHRHCVSEIRNCFFHLGLEAILLRNNKLCLHASCIQTKLGGILFSGVSGIGKSTQADLWCQYREAKQLNGDRPILSKDPSGWSAWGSPYAGSSRYYVNESCAITAIILLKQSPTCSLCRLRPSEAFQRVWPHLTIRSWDASFVDFASTLLLDMIGSIPVFEFSCTPDCQAVDYLEQALRKECSL